MRKKAVFLIFILSVLLVGCSASAQNHRTPQGSTGAQSTPPTLGQHTSDLLEEPTEEEGDTTAQSESPSAPPTEYDASSQSDAPVMTGYLPRGDALQIALDHAQVKRSDLLDLSCELDEENGVIVYQVEFECGLWEYEYQIHAETGEILHVERDND